MKIIIAQQTHSIKIFKNLEKNWDVIIKIIMFIKAQQYVLYENYKVLQLLRS